MLYLVWQLPKANWLLTELHMGDLSCPNLRLYIFWILFHFSGLRSVTCLPLLTAISSEVGETLGSSEVPLPSSDSPSDPIRGCSCTTPINRGVSFGKSSDSIFAIKLNFFRTNMRSFKFWHFAHRIEITGSENKLCTLQRVASLSWKPLNLFG